MVYDGVVARILQEGKDLFYLFMLDPVKNVLVDGINISEHQTYNDLGYDQIMVVNVELKDGTKTLDEIDLDEFIHGDKYGRLDVFIYIKDLLLFTIGDSTNIIKVLILDILEKGEFTDVAVDCINRTKEELKKQK